MAGVTEALQASEGPELGQQMYELVERLYPICRSITGQGVRDSLQILREFIPLETREVPTGTRILDWTVPREWNIRDAYVKDESGRKVIDFRRSNLHVVGYSAPVNEKMSLSDLKPHLHSLPDTPDWIPFRTSYYTETWGFCLAHRELESLEEGEYEVVIDSDLEHGSLTYGELLIPGESDEEVLVSAHICHPSMCNDNLSGVVVVAVLARLLAHTSTRYSYRVLFAPGTIGAITWLASNEDRIHLLKHGLIAANLGDGGPFVFKRTRRGDKELDRVVELVIAEHDGRIIDFSPYGYDERQYGSPGFDLPVGSLTRTPYGEYPEYHTSADDLELVTPANLLDSLRLYLRVIQILERNESLQNKSPKGEPQLGRRGLYRSVGHGNDGRERELAMLWVLNMSDGNTSLVEIAHKAGLSFDVIRAAADDLLGADLLR